MNEIKLKGYIRNIKPSHVIGDIEYDKATLIVPRENGIEDVINLRFKRFSNTYKEDQEIELVGNVRSYSQHIGEDKNKVDIYVFTYFDKPDCGLTSSNDFVVDGRVCKLDKLRVLKSGKKNIHFILANNLEIGKNGQKLNSYLPCIAWGKVAKQVESMKVNDKIKIHGKLQSREYKKYYSDDEFDIKVAHEIYVDSIELLND